MVNPALFPARYGQTLFCRPERLRQFHHAGKNGPEGLLPSAINPCSYTQARSLSTIYGKVKSEYSKGYEAGRSTSIES